MKTQILIYAPQPSSRLFYAARFVLEELLGLEALFTASVEEINSFDGLKINYSRSEIDASIKIIPSGLLNDTGIKKHEPGVGSWKYLPVIFITSQTEAINFDIFSATFYMLTRYEEYLRFSPDSHGRFPAVNSIAYRNAFLEIPVVNLWANKFGILLEEKYADIVIPRKTFDWKSTIDVDAAWAILNRNPIITAAGLIKSFFTGNDFFSRFRVLKGKDPDPFYTFEFLREFHSDNPEKLIYFFPCGSPGGFDRNIHPENKSWQELVKKLSLEYKTGLHPSYRSNKNFKQLQEEHQTLSSTISKPVTESRQHFLKLTFPETYRNLIELGIANDYSMGFADHTGFRAGTSSPFYFFDLEKEKITNLRVWPFVVMDRTLKKYMNLNQEQSCKKLISLIDTVFKSGGIFISLWHNDSISNYGEWKGWRKVYVDMIDYIRHKV